MRRAARILSAVVLVAAVTGVAVASWPGLRGRPFGTFDVRPVTARSGGTTAHGSTAYFFLIDGSTIRLYHIGADPVFAPGGPHGGAVGIMIPTIESVGAVGREWLIVAGIVATAAGVADALVRRRRSRGFPLDPMPLPVDDGPPPAG